MSAAGKLTEVQEAMLTRAECEDFLFREALLLDEWRLDEWLELFEEGATYDVPTAGAADDADSSKLLFYIADSYERLRHRIVRLKDPGAHSEWPRSKTAHLVSNVLILDNEAGGVATVRSTFATYRSKNDITDIFCGHHIHRLKRVGGEIRIASKRSMLDMSNLRPQGRVSIIL